MAVNLVFKTSRWRVCWALLFVYAPSNDNSWVIIELYPYVNCLETRKDYYRTDDWILVRVFYIIRRIWRKLYQP